MARVCLHDWKLVDTGDVNGHLNRATFECAECGEVVHLNENAPSRNRRSKSINSIGVTVEADTDDAARRFRELTRLANEASEAIQTLKAELDGNELTVRQAGKAKLIQVKVFEGGDS